MANKVFINEQDIVECHVIGDQTYESVQTMGSQIETLFSQLSQQHKARLALDDVTQIGQAPPEARNKVVELAKSLPYDRLAMLGSSGVIRFGANLIIRASGRANRLRYFTDRAQAIAWLQERK